MSNRGSPGDLDSYPVHCPFLKHNFGGQGPGPKMENACGQTTLEQRQEMDQPVLIVNVAINW